MLRKLGKSFCNAVPSQIFHDETMKAHNTWNNVCKELMDLKKENRFQDVIVQARRATSELSAYNKIATPPLYESLLNHEVARAMFFLKNFQEASEVNTSAIAALKDHDPSAWAVAYEFEGFIQLALENIQNALHIFTELHEWQHGPARRTLPMVQVTAQELIKTTLLGLGCAQRKLGNLDKAFEYHTTALPLLIEDKDVDNVGICLIECISILIAQKKNPQASETCDKLISWYARHGRESEILLIEEWKAKLV